MRSFEEVERVFGSGCNQTEALTEFLRQDEPPTLASCLATTEDEAELIETTEETLADLAAAWRIAP